MGSNPTVGTTSTDEFGAFGGFAEGSDPEDRDDGCAEQLGEVEEHDWIIDAGRPWPNGPFDPKWRTRRADLAVCPAIVHAREPYV